MTEETSNIKTMTQSVGGAMEGEFQLTPVDTDQRETIFMVPPTRVIPIIFLPGVMGSNLRMAKKQQEKIGRDDNIAWRPDAAADSASRANDKPRERQLNFDPDETEVDYYKYTENKNKFDPTGKATESSDKRHNNVPNDLSDVGLLVSDHEPPQINNTNSQRHPNAATAAQKARWRGWSEISFGDYKSAVMFLEDKLHAIKPPDWYRKIPGAKNLSPWWQKRTQVGAAAPNPQLVTGVPLHEWGASQGDMVEENEVMRIANCLYPTHAMGYNWLQSNEVSAKKTAARIKKLIRSYQDLGHQCDKVILVTHSMGGILARALIHPDMGGINDLVLGVYHSVQPVYGSGAAYKRVRSGVDSGWSPTSAIVARVIGNTGQDVTAVFANAPGPLELLPTEQYGRNWLKVQDHNGKMLTSWPVNSPVSDIYLRSEQEWWRLINPLWVNPAAVSDSTKSSYEATLRKILNAGEFHTKIKDTFHVNTYASYGADSGYATHGTVTYEVHGLSPTSNVLKESPWMWKLVSEDGKGDLMVQSTDGHKFKLKMLDPKEPGDGTVPADLSAAKVKAKVRFVQRKYDHQGSYKADQVLASMLYAVVKIANTADGWKT
jgi:Lecithin:cholesterol acyltransferase